MRKKPPVSLPEFFAVFLLFGLAPLIDNLFVNQNQSSSGLEWRNLGGNLVYRIAGFFLCIELLSRNTRPETSPSLQERKELSFQLSTHDILRGVLFAAIMVVLASAATFASTFFGQYGQNPLMNQLAHEKPAIAVRILFAVSVALTAFFEESFYRCYTLTRLKDFGVPVALAALTSSVIFALAHAYQGPLALALALFFGLFLSALWFRYRSLWTCALAHGLYNLVVLIQSGFLFS